MAAAWIKVSDGRVLISHDRLEAMCGGLPTFKYILKGYPAMQTPAREMNGTEEITCYSLHEDFAVTKADMHLLMDLYSPTPILPTSNEEWTQLKHLGTLFGSSDAIDKAYLEWISAEAKATENANYYPLTPNEDIQEKFEWFTFTRFPRLHSLPPDAAEQRLLQSKMEDGFVFISDANSNARDGTSHFHYRKPKPGTVVHQDQESLPLSIPLASD